MLFATKLSGLEEFNLYERELERLFHSNTTESKHRN